LKKKKHLHVFCLQGLTEPEPERMRIISLQALEFETKCSKNNCIIPQTAPDGNLLFLDFDIFNDPYTGFWGRRFVGNASPDRKRNDLTRFFEKERGGLVDLFGVR
jgi:hypothetical protein